MMRKETYVLLTKRMSGCVTLNCVECKDSLTFSVRCPHDVFQDSTPQPNQMSGRTGPFSGTLLMDSVWAPLTVDDVQFDIAH